MNNQQLSSAHFRNVIINSQTNHKIFNHAKFFLQVVFILAITVPSARAGTEHKAPLTVNTIDSVFNHGIPLEGKVVYVDFWASWCAHCQKSFPWMQDLEDRFGKLGLQVITVNLDKEPAKAKAFLKKLNISLPVYYDSVGTIAKLFDIKAMPTSFLYDRKGHIHTRHQGFKSEDMEDLEASIATLLKPGE